MTIKPDREWWTPAEIAEAGLPDLPATRQGVDAMIMRSGWRAQTSFARRRSGKGGGWEYSWQLFPHRAKRKLLLKVSAPTEPQRPARDDVWTWFEGLPRTVHDKAAARLRIIQAVEALERADACSRDLAVSSIARHEKIGARTIWSWLSMIEGVRADDRLPYLAPRNRASEHKPASREIEPEFFDVLKSDYLRLEAPPFTDCYRRAARVAKAKGWDVPPERTLRRRLDTTVSRPVQILARKGIEALMRLYPSQVRDKTALSAMEATNADFHKFDVFVRWPAAPGSNEPGPIYRPQMVAFQDIFSGRILSWRVDINPNSTAVLLAAGDMITEWGIPQHILLDNGREFAAKAITGGASTRYRFKVKEDDIPGLFTSLGCQIHWATPYHGQAKPIERAFRDMCQSIAKDPRLAGAYTGNTIDAKPENYGSRAIDLEYFLGVLAEGIAEHNTRVGRRSEVAFGRSFAQVFDESYATAPIRKATEAQRRLWLLGAEGLRAETGSGLVRFQGNEFWADWMSAIAGKRIIARFDPAAFWDGLHIYGQDNAYLGHAPVWKKVGFFDADEARMHAKARGDWRRASRAAADAQVRFTALQVGRALDELSPTPEFKPDAKVVKPTFGKPKVAASAAARASNSLVPQDTIAARQAEIATDLDARRMAKVEPEEGSRDRFRRALDLERAGAAGAAITNDQQRWLSVYQTTPEYSSERMLWDDFGDAIFG